MFKGEFENHFKNTFLPPSMRTGLQRQRKSSFFVVNAKGVTNLDTTSL